MAASSGDDSDEAEGVCPTRHKKRQLSKSLQSLKTEVGAIRDTMLTLTGNTTLTPRLNQATWETFKCQICQSHIKPPVIITKCCQNILGCQACVETWYSGPDSALSTCPVCRAEGGQDDTMVLRGLTEFVQQLSENAAQDNS